MSGFVVRIMEEDGCGRMQTRPIGFNDGTDHVQGVDAAHPLPVTITDGVTLTGDISAATEYTEDAALPGDPIGGVMLARRRDTLTAAEVSADGDAIALNATAKGEMRVANADEATALAAILAKLSADPATQTTLAAIAAALAGTLAVSAAALPLPSGAATGANQATGNSSLASIVTALAGTLAVSAASLPLPSGAATGAKQDTGNSALASIVSALAGTLAVSAASLPLPSGAATGAKQDTGNSSLAAIATALAGSLAVTGPMTASQLVSSLQSGTATHTSVNSGTSSVTILASNSARKGARIFNTDANNLFLDLSGGTAAAATRAQVKLGQNEGYTVEAGYTGAITGIWAVDGSGVASVVEFA